jgi:hypothetical protein
VPSTPPSRRVASVSRVGAVVLAAALASIGAPVSSVRAAVAAPVIVAPAPGVETSANPILQWRPVAGATKYRLQVSLTDSFDGDLIYAVDTSNVLGSPPLDLDAGTVRWRVGALDDSGSPGAYAASSFVKTSGLTAPAQTAPADGAVLSQPNDVEVYAWTAVPGAASYELQVAGDASMTSPALYVTELTSAPFTYAQPGHPRYWRVRAMSPNSRTAGPWSAVRTLSVTWTATPTLVAPADDASVRDLVFSWQPVPGASRYEVDVTRSPGDWSTPAATRFTTELTRLSWIGPDYFDPGLVEWRVRALHAVGTPGTPGPWSTTRRVTKVLSPAAQLLTPADGATITTFPNFSWTPVNRASVYKLEVSVTPTFATEVAVHTTTETGFIPAERAESYPGELIAGRTYYWRVAAIDNPHGLPAAPTSAVRSFVYEPPVSELLAPIDGATVTVPTLRWRSVGASAHAVTIKDAGGHTIVHATTQASTYTPRVRLNPSDGPFTWYLEKVLLGGVVTWRTPSATFSVASEEPATATSPTPTIADGWSGWVMPTITWTPMIGAASYDIFYGTALTGRMNGDVRLTYPGFTYEGVTFDSGTHRYQIVAYDAEGIAIGASDVRTFVIVDPPFATHVSPADCGEPTCTALTDTPTFEWDPVVGADFYFLWVSPNPTGERWYYVYGTLFRPLHELPATQPDAPLRWYVGACAAGKCSYNGPTWAYHQTHPAVLLDSPADGATVADQIELSWKETPVAPSQASRYQIGFWNESGSAGSSEMTESPTFTMAGLDGLWYWRVRGYGEYGVPFPWSETRSVRRASQPPVLLGPAAGAAFDHAPLLRWEPQAYAKAYEVEVYQGDGSTLRPIDRVAWGESITSAGTTFRELAPGEYVWRVRRVEPSNQPGPWSSLRGFEISAADAPVLLEPENDSASTGPPLLFRWAAADRAVIYRFESSSSPTFSTLHEEITLTTTHWAPVKPYLDGTWYWRVKSYGPSWQPLATSEIRSLHGPDTTGPVGSVQINAGAVRTNSSNVILSFAASDAGSGVALMRLRNDSGAWSAWRSYSSASPWTLAATNGTRMVSVEYRDGAGHTSAAASDTIVLDTVAPTARSPVASVALGSTLEKSSARLLLSWSATDPTPGTGIGSYILQRRTYSGTVWGAWTNVALPGPTSTSMTLSAVALNVSHQFRVRAQDRAGNWSAWSSGPVVRPVARDDSYSAITYSGTWARQASAQAYGGYLRGTSSSARARFSFTGRAVALVSVRAPSRGKAAIYIDGFYQRTIDLYASSWQFRRIVYSASFAAAGAHVLEVRVTGTRSSRASGARVDLDAAAVIL